MAAFGLDNVAISALNYMGEPEIEGPDPDFDPYAHLLPGEELIASEFADARSLSEMGLIRRRIRNEEELRRQLAQGPLNEFLASTLAVAGDPVSYIPLFGWAAKGGKAARLAKIGLAGAAEVALSEAVLQATQQTRTLSESAAAVLVGGAFSFGLGAAAFGAGAARTAARDAVARFRQQKAEQAVKDLDTMLRAEFPQELGVPAENVPVKGEITEEAVQKAVDNLALPDESSVGARQAGPRPEDTELVPTGGVAEALAKLGRVGLAAPALELAASSIGKSREIVHKLVDTGLVTKGMVRGLAGPEPVDLRIRRYNAVIASMARAHKDLYRSYRRRVGRSAALSQDQFYREVGKAMRRDDLSKIPEAQELARRLRQDVVDPLTKEAQAYGLLPEGVSPRTARSYFTRVYDRAKIRARRTEFVARVEAWLRRALSDENIQADAEYRAVAEQITDAVLGQPYDRVPFIKIPRQRGPTKERTFLIPDHEIEDFLESNSLEVMPRFVRTMAADIEMTKAFGRPDAEEAIAAEIRDEAARLAAQAKTEAERTAIQRRAEREALVAQSLAQHIRGTIRPLDATFRPLRRTLRTVRTLNFVRLLGSVLLSSIPDVGRIVMEEGLARTFGTLLDQFGRAFKGIRLSKKEAQMAGTALEIELATRNRAILDLGERYLDETKMEHWVDTLGQKFSTLTLLNHWNEALKGWTASLVSTRILSTIDRLAKGKALSKRDRLKLVKSGISPEMAERIAAQADKWEKIGTVIHANTAEWTDPEAIDAFRTALLRDVDNTIITPGAGDAPLWTTNEIGKTIFQFKRFAAASTQRILLSGLQYRDMAAMNGIMLMVGLGALATALRDVASDGEVRDRTVRQWAVDAVDRSGVLSMFFEFDALADKFTGGLSIQRAISGQEASRFASRDVLGQMLGPTAGALEDAASAVRGAMSGEFTQSDLHKLRRLVPGQNLFYLRHMLDKVEEGVAKAAGLPEKQPRKRRNTSAAVLPDED